MVGCRLASVGSRVLVTLCRMIYVEELVLNIDLRDDPTFRLVLTETGRDCTLVGLSFFTLRYMK